MCPRGWGIGRHKVEGAHQEALPAVIHLSSLELATERVWMPSKLVCCLSNLCLAARMLRSQFLLHCVDLLRRSAKLSSKWCLSARERAWAPAGNSAVTLADCCWVLCQTVVHSLQQQAIQQPLGMETWLAIICQTCIFYEFCANWQWWFIHCAQTHVICPYSKPPRGSQRCHKGTLWVLFGHQIQTKCSIAMHRCHLPGLVQFNSLLRNVDTLAQCTIVGRQRGGFGYNDFANLMLNNDIHEDNGPSWWWCWQWKWQQCCGQSCDNQCWKNELSMSAVPLNLLALTRDDSIQFDCWPFGEPQWQIQMHAKVHRWGPFTLESIWQFTLWKSRCTVASRCPQKVSLPGQRLWFIHHLDVASAKKSCGWLALKLAKGTVCLQLDCC